RLRGVRCEPARRPRLRPDRHARHDARLPAGGGHRPAHGRPPLHRRRPVAQHHRQRLHATGPGRPRRGAVPLMDTPTATASAATSSGATTSGSAATAPRGVLGRTWADRVRDASIAHADVAGTPLVTDRPWIIAHRGYSAAAPENTLAAVDAARMIGADWIEVDLHVSADGTPIVIHDQSVDRTTDGSGQVARLDDDALSRLDAGSWAGPGFAGQRLPKLDTLLTDVSAKGGRLLLELKGEWSPGAVASVAGSIIDAGMADRTLVQSFAPGTLAHLRDIAPMV